MHVSPQLLAYNSLATCSYNPTDKCDNYLSTGVVTMAMKVLHSSCNMCINDLPYMYALMPMFTTIT